MLTPISAAELAAALPHVLEAPRNSSIVDQLCTRPARNARVFPDRITLSSASGVAEDREMQMPWLKRDDGSPDPRIQVSILPRRVLDLVWRDREGTAHPGDTIIADFNTTLENLPEGSLLRVGSAVLRVSGLWNRGCAKWRGRYGVDAYAWTSNPAHEPLRLRGILCAIEEDGVVSLGDRIEKL